MTADTSHPDDEATTVTVVDPYQVSYEGTVYGPGKTVEVPRQLAKNWLLWGWVTEAKEAPKRGRPRSK
jgi:hypothetical protein